MFAGLHNQSPVLIMLDMCRYEWYGVIGSLVWDIA